MRGWDRRSVTNTWVIAFSSPNCKSEFASPLCLIVDLTCRRRGAFGLPAKTTAQINARHPGCLMSNYKHCSHHRFKLSCCVKPCGCRLRWRGISQPYSPCAGGAGRNKVPSRGCGLEGCSFSLAEMGAGALQTGLWYLAFIGFLLKILWLSNVTAPELGTRAGIASCNTAWFRQEAAQRNTGG